MDRRFMHMALALGRRGLGATWPNPAVGCVIVNDGIVVGRGWTAPTGRPHAETQALKQAGPAAQGATAYVTLEPCSHFGQTPPCATALIEAGITRVVAAINDSDPRVSGKGFALLRDAGIEVVTGICSDQAAYDHAGFFQRIEHSRPWVTLKLASSFDGRIATASGHSQWITGAEARRYVHGLRLSHDAVLVGGGTARADDPTLTVRGFGRTTHQPVRVVMSQTLDIPHNGHLFQTAKDVPVWIIHGKGVKDEVAEHWRKAGAELFQCSTRDGQLDAKAAMTILAQQGITRVFCEGGGQLAASLLSADLVNELVGFTAGLSIGGDGRPSIGDLGLERLSEAQRFTCVGTRRIGADIVHRWHRLPNSVPD